MMGDGQQHSGLVGGSTAALRLGCPASYKASQIAPERPGGAAAVRGSALHQLAEGVLRGGDRPPVAATVVDLPGHGPVQLSAGDVADLHLALDAWGRFAAEREARVLAVEGRYPFPGIDGAFGTADVVWMARDGVRWGVWDWKFGAGIVRAEDNAQLQFYAAAARAAHPEVRKAGAIELAICQPASAQLVDLWRTDHAALDAYEARLRDAIAQAMTERPPARSGPWCQWAPCRLTCPLRGQQAARLAAMLAAR